MKYTIKARQGSFTITLTAQGWVTDTKPCVPYTSFFDNFDDAVKAMNLNRTEFFDDTWVQPVYGTL
jgi:hypothetical protein